MINKGRHEELEVFFGSFSLFCKAEQQHCAKSEEIDR